MNKLTILFILGIVCYFTYSKINEFYNILNDLKSSSNTVLAITAVTKDKLDIKDKEIYDARKQIAKYDANYKAFSGTNCMRCHLETSNLLPYDKRHLTLQDYIKVVRQGVTGLMPAYIDSQNKGSRNITDGELIRQFKILKDFENEFK